MRKWQVMTLDNEAAQEVALLFRDKQGKYDEDRKDEIKRILNLLASQDDPREPEAGSGLIVDPVKSTPGWHRVKVSRYAARIIFRLLVERGNRLVKLPDRELPGEDEVRYIDVVRAGRHPTVYGKGLRDRYNKLGGH